jgi:hypothetical protein
MNNRWLEDYIKLVLRLDKAMEHVDSSFFLDTYYGPVEWKNDLIDEPVKGFNELTTQAEALLDRLPIQGFEVGRELYLQKHLQALDTISRVEAGEALSFYEIVARVFDVEPIWISEEEFEQGLKQLDQALPGRGDIRERYQAWQESMRIPIDQNEAILPVMRLILDEIRARTEVLVQLPEGESLDIQPIRKVNYGAANWYLGNYRSRLELNLDRPIYAFSLLPQMCHETYPGHHTESCLKEHHLYRGKGYIEQSTYFALGPQLVVSEGIASVAAEMIFSPAEAAEWIRGTIMPFCGKPAAEADLALVLDAFTLISPDGLSSNMATLIEAGRPVEEVVRYALALTPFSEKQIQSYLPSLGSLLSRLYAFSYSHGSRLIRPLIDSPQRDENIRRLLTEQVTPSSISQMI